VEICGIAGEAARVAYWRNSGSASARLTPRVLADCVHLLHHAGILAGIRSRMSSYPASTPVQMLDGFYEHAMSPWPVSPTVMPTGALPPLSLRQPLSAR
jgi:hypothetical protein